MPKSDRIWKHLAVVFVAVLGFYLLGFSWLEHRRSRLGPWEVTFIKTNASAPAILINQPALQITNLQIDFTTALTVAPTNARIEFVPGRAVPFPVPFGECVFMDPTFLPGTVTLDLFEHRIEMLPRTLRIDGREHEWNSETHVGINAIH